MIQITITIYSNDDGQTIFDILPPVGDYPTGLEEAAWFELEPELRRLLAVTP
jgi:hypothetical protein